MKKIVLSLFVIGLIYGCKKDQITPNPTTSNQVGANEETANRNPEMSEIENNILDFEELMDSDEGGDATMSVEDAVWNLEALANYAHRTGQEYNMIEKKTETITLEKNDNEIKIADIRTEYLRINEMLGSVEGGKFLVVLDVNIEEETESEVTFNIISNLGGNRIFNQQFSESWNWGFGAYKCGYTGPWLNIDAADIITSRLPISISMNQIVTSVVSTGFLTNMQAQPLANPFGYDNGPLFAAHGTGTGVVPTICLTPAMLAHYESGVIALAEDLRPTGNITILHYLESTNSLSQTQWDALHLADITYATVTSGYVLAP